MHIVMVVDDNPSITDILCRMIRQAGYHAVEIHSGEEALNFLKLEIPDLILLDILMEPMNGWETLEKIKSDESTKNIPVMMITAKSIAADEIERYSPLIEDYIQKPITKQQLYSLIGEFFHREKAFDDELSRARETGTDPAVIEDYLQLMHDIEIQQRLLCLLWNVHRNSRTDDSDRGELLDAIARMETNLEVLQARVKEVKLDLQ